MSTEEDVLQQLVSLQQDFQHLNRQLENLYLCSKPVLSFSEFCRFASISEHTGRSLTRSGKIPFFRPFDKKLYIDRETAISVLMKNPVVSNSQIEVKAFNHLITSKTAV